MVSQLPMLFGEAAENAAKAPAGYVILLCTLAMLFVALVLPFMLGTFIAKSLRMKEYGWKIGVVLLTFVCSVVIMSPKPEWLGVGWPPKLGVDLAGGVILVYEVDFAETGATSTAKGKTAIDNESNFNMSSLIQALVRRLNPSGTKEIVIRPFGSKQVEIIIPEVDPLEIEKIKREISTAGILEFRIVANSHDHAPQIEVARQQSLNPDEKLARARSVRDDAGKEVARWAGVARESFKEKGEFRFKVKTWHDTIRNAKTGEFLDVAAADRALLDQDKLSFEEYLKQQGITDIDVLMDTGDGADVTGAHLGVVGLGHDETMHPQVDFAMKNSDGARRMGQLTGMNVPSNDIHRLLGIMLDGNLLSAPRIQSTISSQGRITGRFTTEEVEFLVGILRAGSLPAVLKKEPISDNRIDPTLGKDTIIKGSLSLVISMAAVVLFIIVYYRASGVIACGALALNLLITVALMILIRAPFSLPGLAGMVLTVGMAVDANVLIYERMREEIARGAALRMVIRNGFDRAFTTIIDSNLTTIITSVVLYVIGTDQVRGFAVTLTLGILSSMFTAVFCSRVVFEIAERKRWLTELKMMRFFGKTEIDFMRIWKVCAGISVVLIAIGLAATFVRGKGILDIDFLGGTSVQLVMKDKTTTDAVRDKLEKTLNNRLVDNEKIQFTLTGITLTGPDAAKYDRRLFKIDTSIKKIKTLETELSDIFKDESGNSQLTSYAMTFDEPQEVKSEKRAASETPVIGEKPAEENKPAPSDSPAPENKPAAEPAAEKPGEKSAPVKDKDGEPGSGCDDEVAQPADDSTSQKEEAEPKKEADTKSENPQPAADAPAAKPEDQTPAPENKPAPTARDEAAPIAATKTAAPRVIVYSEAKLTFLDNPINAATLRDRINSAARDLSLPDPDLTMTNPAADESETKLHATWTVRMNMSPAAAKVILQNVQTKLTSTPVFFSSSEIGGAVAGDTQLKAINALLASMVGIVLYIWLRFQKVVWGLAAVLALVHDVLMMLGAIAVSYWLAPVFGFAGVEEFKINLVMVAAFLTLVGFSINDTIVLFDRIREVRGKSPHITREMINLSTNQTLSRTILTSLTVLIVVVILYFSGGQTIHGFAFSLVVGVIVGTYSTVMIAAPVLLWLSEPDEAAKSEKSAAPKKAVVPER